MTGLKLQQYKGEIEIRVDLGMEGGCYPSVFCARMDFMGEYYTFYSNYIRVNVRLRTSFTVGRSTFPIP